MTKLKYGSDEYKQRQSENALKRRKQTEFVRWLDKLPVADKAKILSVKQFNPGFSTAPNGPILLKYFTENVWPGIELREKLKGYYTNVEQAEEKETSQATTKTE